MCVCESAFVQRVYVEEVRLYVFVLLIRLL